MLFIDKICMYTIKTYSKVDPKIVKGGFSLLIHPPYICFFVNVQNLSRFRLSLQCPLIRGTGGLKSFKNVTD